jgi:hypothetical protein
MFNSIQNSITSLIVGVRLCYVGFVLEVTISLSEQFSANSNLKRNLELFQYPLGFVRSYNNKK